jgi:membrane-associated phospholipid phosphatase
MTKAIAPKRKVAAVQPFSYGTLGGTQPPGGYKPKRLIENDLLAAATCAGAQTLAAALPKPRSLKTKTSMVAVKYDKGLADSLEAGNDWVRMNLTAGELLADMKIGLLGDKGTANAKVTISLRAKKMVFAAPKSKDLDAAIACVATLQTGGVLNRDEIVAQANDAALFIALALNPHPVRNRHVLELFDVLELVLARPLYETKLHLDVSRPSQHPKGKRSIHPVVPVPRHQSFPSGHASYAWALVELLIALLPLATDSGTYLRALSARIAANREAAGLHTSLDSEAGERLGQALAKWLTAAANDPKRYPKWAALVAQAQIGWK